MPATQLKDYYRILEINSAATTEEVKKAFRKMALRYHPDTNGGNALAESSFRDIKEAYSVLGNDSSRREYDEACWLAGMRSRVSEKQQVTGEWLLQEAIKLGRHMGSVDVYRMSHSALKDYIFQLLNDRHIAVLLQNKDTSVNEGITKMIILASKGLKYQYMMPVAERLKLLAAENYELSAIITEALRERKRQATWEKRMPYVIGIVTLIIVIAMYFWASK